MWRDYLEALWSDASLYPGVSDTEIDAVEHRLGMPFPTELRNLYSETNGVYLEDAYMWVVWSLDELLKRNAYMRSGNVAFYDKPSDDLFFFGDLGNGDLVAFSRNGKGFPFMSVGKWDHEDGEYREDGTQLRDCLEKS